ncbi:YybH family protein [Rhizobium ruizarguesonis]|uniref:YybH family protein n=1 Tax=Rhizobium ruizarguesonis TaxID=2081791 RepID=UPI00102FDE42|nr:SgcJ/EcaC family oxidoreductase [Rhizobium ruizarguesonis]TBD47073.1 SgcJ/EcaC family oxidoreductase [Rhizobium ruizarguesonis]
MSQNNVDTTAIRGLVAKYIEVIARSTADELVSLFTEDGVIMAPDAPTMEGTEQLRAFFNHAFTTIKIDPKIYIDEVVVSGDYAFARCHSEVHVTLLEPKASHSEANRELFVFRKDGGEWKIARYMFNKQQTAN